MLEYLRAVTARIALGGSMCGPLVICWFSGAKDITRYVSRTSIGV